MIMQHHRKPLYIKKNRFLDLHSNIKKNNDNVLNLVTNLILIH